MRSNTHLPLSLLAAGLLIPAPEVAAQSSTDASTGASFVGTLASPSNIASGPCSLSGSLAGPIFLTKGADGGFSGGAAISSPFSGSLDLFDLDDFPLTGTFNGNLGDAGSASGSILGGSSIDDNGTSIDVNVQLQGSAACGLVSLQLVSDMVAFRYDNLAVTQIGFIENTTVPTLGVLRGVVGSALAALQQGGAGLARLDNGIRYGGPAAGDGGGWGVWAAYQRNTFDDEFTGSRYSADADILLFGADFSPSDSMVLGAMIGYETVDADTLFNGGTQDTDGITAAVYVGALIGDGAVGGFDLSADAAIGIGSTDIDQTRMLIDGTGLSSSTDSFRWFAAGNLSGVRAIGNWRLGGRLGLLYAEDDADGYTESAGLVFGDRSVEIGQVDVEGNVAYSMRMGGTTIEPFASATYENEFSRDDIATPLLRHPNDEDGVRLRAGLRWFDASGAISGSFSYSALVDKEDVDASTLALQLRIDF